MSMLENFEKTINKNYTVEYVVKLRNNDEDLYDFISTTMVYQMRFGLSYSDSLQYSIFCAMVIINNYEPLDREDFYELERKTLQRFFKTLFLKTSDEARKDKILDYILELEKLYV